jgi:hypothetical protein
MKLPVPDAEWGCQHTDASLLCTGNVKACIVLIDDVQKLAAQLALDVVDTSWMAALDHGARRAYEFTATETAAILKDIVLNVAITGSINSEFGELMVSMASRRALEFVFGHSVIPLAELWKPQVRQNEGFDFHTICSKAVIYFGEAKFSSTESPHGVAINQIADFIGNEKHLRDRNHLVNLVDQAAIARLDGDEYGVVAAFSVGSENLQLIVKNALNNALKLASKHVLVDIYLVGVKYEP